MVRPRCITAVYGFEQKKCYFYYVQNTNHSPIIQHAYIYDIAQTYNTYILGLCLSGVFYVLCTMLCVCVCIPRDITRCGRNATPAIRQSESKHRKPNPVRKRTDTICRSAWHNFAAAVQRSPLSTATRSVSELNKVRGNDLFSRKNGDYLRACDFFIKD